MKSELVEMFEEWIQNDGQSCIDFNLLMTAGYEQVLRERLLKAFLAGAQAQDEFYEELIDQIK